MPAPSPAAESYPCLIVGAGQAGVTLSYCLQQLDVPHLMLECDRPFSDWYHHRWDSFAMNTPNGFNQLPGQQQRFAPTQPRSSFGTLDDAKEYFAAYLRAVTPPIRIECVQSVGENRDGSWQVVTDSQTYRTENLAICTGHASQKKLPPVAANLPASFADKQLHSSEYRSRDQITTDNVLVVGSGSSGVQICHELAASGRFQHVSLAQSGNFVLPWSVLGVSTYTLMRWLGVFKITGDSWLGRRMFRKLRMEGDPATPPSPKRLAKKYGVKRVGRVQNIDLDARVVNCSDGQNVPLDDLFIVWCTGFSANYGFLDVYVRNAILDATGYPKHQRGVSQDASGLFFVGLRFQHTFASQDIGGVGQDAQYIAEQIATRVQQPETTPDFFIHA